MIALAAAACSDETEQPTHIDLSAFDANTYYEVLRADTTFLDIETSSIAGEDAWRSLVEQQRRDGLSSLTTEQRRQLLAGAMKAYVTLVERAEFSYATSDATATSTEVYASEDGLFSDLLERHARYEGIEVEYGGVILEYPTALEERIDVLDPTPPDPPYGRMWTNVTGSVKCVELSGNDFVGFLRLAYVGRLGSILEGEASGLVRSGNRYLEEITVRDPDFPATYWLDVNSLWPVKWQETSTDDLPSDDDGPITRTLEPTLVAVNGDLDVVPPTSCDTEDARAE